VAEEREQEQRRARIADAALRLLAREGARGLTHRAVDAELQLPSGSTSYYFRTRAALLAAAAERMLELDMRDLARISADSAGVSQLLERWLAPEGRERSMARMELLLAAARDPELGVMASARERFIDHAVAGQRGAAAHEARATATALVALVDGLTLHGLVTGELSRSAAKRMFERLMAPARQVDRPAAAKSRARVKS
jgi:DNA-binding transcriptional regulator YbjK